MLGRGQGTLTGVEWRSGLGEHSRLLALMPAYEAENPSLVIEWSARNLIVITLPMLVMVGGSWVPQYLAAFKINPIAY